MSLYLLLTVVIEAAAAFALGVRNMQSQSAVLFANLITNPLLNCLLTIVQFYISPGAYYYFLIPLEMIVVMVEGMIYNKFIELKMNPYLFSLILNLCSYLIGTGILKAAKAFGG